VYVCEVNEPAEVILSNEHTEFRWFEPKEASALLQIKYPKEFTDKIAVFKK